MAIKSIPVPPVDAPVLPDVATISSIKAIAGGYADADQQMRAFEWIVRTASGIGSQSYRSADSHATAFMEGRRFVGAQLIAIQTIDLDKLKKGINHGR